MANPFLAYLYHLKLQRLTMVNLPIPIYTLHIPVKYEERTNIKKGIAIQNVYALNIIET